MALVVALLLQAADPALAKVDFDLGSIAPPVDITVTASPDRWRLRRERPIFELPPPPRLGFSIGNTRIAPDAVRGRLGDAQVHVGLTIPF